MVSGVRISTLRMPAARELYCKMYCVEDADVFREAMATLQDLNRHQSSQSSHRTACASLGRSRRSMCHQPRAKDLRSSYTVLS